ncbi:MAG TPA: hypothetical protein VE526_08800 [Solirubrobacteraceae bacterium]|jgi:di/tripeptidase|nr:hypothetical protein [Solirubrobacteraceae bacterium]
MTTAPPHGRFELLMTVAEEVGLAGAQALDPALLTGDLLLNLDSEEDGALTIGCAGSEEHVLTLEAPREPLPPTAEVVRVTVGGGRGGHSGMDITAGRANAVKLLAHALRGAGDGVRIAAFDGGASAKRPGLPMLSFGPEIEGPHAPGERLHVPSVDRFMRLLAALLDEGSR